MVRGPWNQDFLHELEQFPKGAHDDQIDAVSVLWEMVRKRDVLLLCHRRG
jgi:predicted phage terminase large subunit-like protein